MTNITISTRDLNASDLPVLLRILQNTWDFGDFVRSDAAERTVAYYLSKHLQNSRFARVILVNSEVCGCLLGNIARYPDKLNHPSIQSFCRQAEQEWQTVTSVAEREHWLEDWLGPEQIVSNLAKEKGLYPKNASHLNLFVVDSTKKGMGLGSRLLTEFEYAHTQHNGKASILLHTDTWCAWQFYDKRGYQRITSVDVRESDQCIGQYFLYGKTL